MPIFVSMTSGCCQSGPCSVTRSVTNWAGAPERRRWRAKGEPSSSGLRTLPFPIRPSVSVPWVSRGSFQMLADDRRVGWWYGPRWPHGFMTSG